jgi:hypothetical protein
MWILTVLRWQRRYLLYCSMSSEHHRKNDSLCFIITRDLLFTLCWHASTDAMISLLSTSSMLSLPSSSISENLFFSIDVILVLLVYFHRRQTMLIDASYYRWHDQVVKMMGVNNENRSRCFSTFTSSSAFDSLLNTCHIILAERIYTMMTPSYTIGLIHAFFKEKQESDHSIDFSHRMPWRVDDL